MAEGWKSWLIYLVSERHMNDWNLLDTHCHLDLYREPRSVLESIQNQRIRTIAVTNAPSVFDGNRERFGHLPTVSIALGMHPELVAERSNEMGRFIDLLTETRFVGEVGLDYSLPDAANQSLQREVFQQVLDACHDSGDKILSVHSRRAAKDSLAMIGSGFRGKVIMHWFSGSVRAAVDTPDYVYFSINTAMIRSQAGKKLVTELQPSRILTETDGPFVRVDDRPADPRDVSSVLSFLADQWHCNAETASQRVKANFEQLVASTSV